MPLLLLLALALTAGSASWLVARHYPASASASAGPTLEAARKVGESVGRHPRLRAFLKARLDPAAATGLLLTLALLIAIGGGVLLGALAYATRTNSELTGIDNGVAKWGDRHASPLSTHALNGVTQLGSIYTILALCVVLIAAAAIRQRSIWVAVFIVAVIGGEEILTSTVKQLDDRLRPTFNPAAATLGPSFPSGHSATAAAFYAAAALVIGRWQNPRVRAALVGLAVGIAVAVASSRVLLDVHWLTDVIAGLGLGWAWFAVCAIAFGGRILRFGATAETAAAVADATDPARAGSRNADRTRRSEQAVTHSPRPEHSCPNRSLM
jgi:membrane-associated phospholipid phosphatase